MKEQLGIIILFIFVSVQAAHKDILSDSSLKDVTKNPEWISLLEKSSRARLVKKAKEPELKEDQPCTSELYTCLDCHTSRVCKPTADEKNPFTEAGRTICSGQFPYCNGVTGTCDSEVSDICGEVDNDFICMGVKKYPDSNCKNFHFCDKNYVAHKFECLVEGESYNALTGTCDSRAACGGFQCKGYQGTKVPHDNYKGYFAYCDKEGKALLVDSCKGDYELNMTSQQCEPVCKNNGLVQDVDDCNAYYQCTSIFMNKDSSYMQREKKHCPENQGFNPQTFQCVPTADLPADTKCLK